MLYFKICFNDILDMIKHIKKPKRTQINCFIFKLFGKNIILMMNNASIGNKIKCFFFMFLLCPNVIINKLKHKILREGFFMDELPKVFENTIDKEINNSQDRIIVNERENLNFDSILSDDKYAFNHKYKIELSNGLFIEDSIIQIIGNMLIIIKNTYQN